MTIPTQITLTLVAFTVLFLGTCVLVHKVNR